MMTGQKRAEIEGVLKSAGLEGLTIYRNKSGDEYIPIRAEARAIVSKGDWKVNVAAALQDVVTASRVAQDRFEEVIDNS